MEKLVGKDVEPIWIKILYQKKMPTPGDVGVFCPDPGSNQGPLDLQSNALPTELSGPANVPINRHNVT